MAGVMVSKYELERGSMVRLLYPTSFLPLEHAAEVYTRRSVFRAYSNRTAVKCMRHLYGGRTGLA